jgi:hypothetical protein
MEIDMGMNNKIICSICGAALCAHLAHERHQNADYITRPLAKKPALDTLVYIRLPHGEDPEAPSGPVRLPGTIAVSSNGGNASASATVTLAGVSAFGRAGDLVWNPNAGTLNLGGGSTDVRSGSNIGSIGLASVSVEAPPSTTLPSS